MAKVVNTAKQTSTVAAESHQSYFRNIGAHLKEAITHKVSELIVEGEKVKTGPFDLKEIMVDNGFDFDKMPVLGTEKGNLCEYFQVKSDASDEMVDSDAFKETFLGTEEGQTCLRQLADAKLAKKADTEHQAKIYAEQKGDQFFLSDEISMINARITAGRNLYRSAVGLYQRECEYDEKMDEKKVTIKANTYIHNGHEKQKRSTTPYLMFDPSSPGQFQRLTVKNMIKLNFDEALKNGGTYQACKDTLKKGAKDKTGKWSIKNWDGFVNATNTYASYIDDESEDGEKNVNAILKRLGRDDSDDAKEALCDLELRLHKLITPEMRKWYHDLLVSGTGGSGQGKETVAA